MKDPLVDKIYLLEKFPGKGGWTYAAIPEVIQNKNNPFGWVKVKGTIDGYAFQQHKLMPMGEGRLFFSVKAEIRKKIKKEAGDTVHIILYPDESPVEVPEEIIACFKNEKPALWDAFTKLSEGKRKSYLDHIYSAKTEETKVQRIVSMMEDLHKEL